MAENCGNGLDVNIKNMNKGGNERGDNQENALIVEEIKKTEGVFGPWQVVNRRRRGQDRKFEGASARGKNNFEMLNESINQYMQIVTENNDKEVIIVDQNGTSLNKENETVDKEDRDHRESVLIEGEKEKKEGKKVILYKKKENNQVVKERVGMKITVENKKEEVQEVMFKTMTINEMNIGEEQNKDEKGRKKMDELSDKLSKSCLKILENKYVEDDFLEEGMDP
ncbi:hypothetical protein Cni_G16655 [Canna indica]|uniref:Uncharacterized protein n=1 Tax=Canna indica TaxID=4628 RepID=A0AAQ3QH00_9LILI|nr:hypothetical protein Cni_G16655 [Canna indica]